MIEPETDRRGRVIGTNMGVTLFRAVAEGLRCPTCKRFRTVTPTGCVCVPCNSRLTILRGIDLLRARQVRAVLATQSLHAESPGDAK
jgi:hypothetical protein